MSRGARYGWRDKRSTESGNTPALLAGSGGGYKLSGELGERRGVQITPRSSPRSNMHRCRRVGYAKNAAEKECAPT